MQLNELKKGFMCPLCKKDGGIEVDFHRYPNNRDIIGKCYYCKRLVNVNKKREFDCKEDNWYLFKK